ncbi:AraC family transcriptional regulator (fragment) [Flavobacterium sp. 9AF]
MSENLSPNKKYKSLLFFFSDTFLDEFITKYNFNNSYYNNVKEESKFKVLPYDEFLLNFITSLQQLLSSNIVKNEHFLKLKLEEVLFYMVQKYGIETIAFLHQPIIQQHHVRLKKIVEKNIFSKLTLDELAFLSHMSLSTFKREFYKVYKMPPSKWIQEKRLEKSAEMLLLNKERPIDIYTAIGYENFSSFTQSFKHKYGITPKQYQQKKMNQ